MPESGVISVPALSLYVIQGAPYFSISAFISGPFKNAQGAPFSSNRVRTHKFARAWHYVGTLSFQQPMADLMNYLVRTAEFIVLSPTLSPFASTRFLKLIFM